MSRIEELRLEVRKRRSAVTAKERRILNNTGIDLKDTPEDPRRPPKVIKKYNTKQLYTYLGELNAFMMRDNGYVPDSSGGFIRKRDWLRYKRSERKLNKIVEAHFDNIGGINDPYRNVTIREAESSYVPDTKRAQGEIRHRPYNEVNRNSKNIKNAAALKKLQDQVEGKLDKGYFPKAIAAGRKQANQMLDGAGLTDLKEMVASLSNRQFDVLWNYWGFAGRLSQAYVNYRNKNVREMDRNDPLTAQDKDNIREDVKKYLDDALAIKFESGKNAILKKNISNKNKNTKIRAEYNKTFGIE